MQVSVEQSGAIERKLTIAVPSDAIQSEVGKRLKEVARTARIPGFRPGRAPQSIIDRRYRPGVTSEVISETVNSSYVDALEQEKIAPAGLVSIDPRPYQPGEDFQYVATVELFPEIPNPTLNGQTIKRPVVEVADEDVERTMQDIRRRNQDYAPSEEAAADGDRLTIDFAGAIDGAEFSGGSAEGHRFLLGQGSMLPEFEAGLIGARAGEEKTVAVTFPEAYHAAELSGKTAEFKVAVKAVDKPALPELDDEFARRLGVADGGIDKMRAEVADNLRAQLKARLRTTMRDRVLEALCAVNQIEIPKTLVEQEVEQMVKMLEQQGVAAPGPAAREAYETPARERVELSLIARGVVDKHGIEADEAAVRASIEAVAQEYEEPDLYIMRHMQDPKLRERFENMVIEDRIVEKMLETARVEDEKMSFQDFMSPPAAPEAAPETAEAG